MSGDDTAPAVDRATLGNLRREAADVIARWHGYGSRIPPDEVAGYVLDAVLPKIAAAVREAARREVAEEFVAEAWKYANKRSSFVGTFVY